MQLLCILGFFRAHWLLIIPTFETLLKKDFLLCNQFYLIGCVCVYERTYVYIVSSSCAVLIIASIIFFAFVRKRVARNETS